MLDFTIKEKIVIIFLSSLLLIGFLMSNYAIDNLDSQKGVYNQKQARTIIINILDELRLEEKNKKQKIRRALFIANKYDLMNFLNKEIKKRNIDTML
ncbi:MAG: hypothetical protein ACOCP8_02700 [archaeon]